ncbi:MAG: helix-turn-helix domain-containing protein [Pseudomonadota bacterium]
MKWSDLSNDRCPVARSMSVFGDRWTLLIIRDCFLGATRFEQFQESLGVTRHVLADRLSKLVEHEVLEKRAYHDRPPRYDYVLTEQGRAIGPALQALKAWGRTHIPRDDSF